MSLDNMVGGGEYSELGLRFGAQVKRKSPCNGDGSPGIECQRKSG